jgi:multicomponent Na+:H+ antiporter subunit F
VPDFLFGAAVFVLAVTGLGLVRLLIGPSAGDRMMAVQLLGAGAGAAALLVAIASGVTAIVDIALVLVLLAAFAAVAIAGAPQPRRPEGGGEG